MEESPRERAISLEPSCSNRRNPFEDIAETTSRKRQRVSSGGSRSRSMEASTDSDPVLDPTPRREDHKAEAGEPPSTPTRLPSEPLEPTSRVTINLRNRLESIPSSPPSPSTPSRTIHAEVDINPRMSIESESDALSTGPVIETPSTSSSAMGSPRIELVTVDDEEEEDIPVAIISDDVPYEDPLRTFPYLGRDETLRDCVTRLARFFQYESIETDETFCKVRDWIDSVLNTHSPEDFFALYIRDREFWECIPSVIWALSSRSRFFGEFLHRARGRTALSEMFCQFARLTGKFVAMDALTLSTPLEESDDQSYDLGSRVYINAFGYLTRKDENSHIGTNLDRHYSWDWDEDIVAMLDQFQTEGGSVSNLTRLVEGHLRIMSKEPKAIDDLLEPNKIVIRLVTDAWSALDGADDYRFVATELRKKVSDGYKFFKVMATGLEIIIEKHLTCLTADAASTYLQGLRSIYYYSLQIETPNSQRLLNQVLEIPRDYRSVVVALEWKLTILKRLIMSTQMQLRVAGVTMMCQDLLNTFLDMRQKVSDPARSPLLLYFSKFLLKHKLVDYLLGVGSHPEIINESWNILGFLLVTKTYTQEQADKIWQTVMTSQDPRVVEAILKVVTKCFNLFDYSSLIYLCKKAIDIPFDSFSFAMREFCHCLFRDINKKSIDEKMSHIGPTPYDLLVRLIKESSMPCNEGSTRTLSIFNFAMGSFGDLLSRGPAPEYRDTIYEQCIRDISAKTEEAAGSICIITMLLKGRSMLQELHVLTTEHGLTQLLVEELESLAAIGPDSPGRPIRNSPADQARRDLLLTIIMNEPTSISPELGKRLWDVLVGVKSKSVMDRDISWQILTNAAKATSSTNNVFISACFKEYLPTLPTHCLTQGALDFAKADLLAWESERCLEGQDKSFEAPAIQQLWQMILTAPPNSIDATAISALVEIFVGSSPILAISRAKARTVHLAFVDRCMRSLKGAAAMLKSFGEEGLGQSDEAMVIVASDDQVQEQEKIFARSLAVLREFLRAYNLKPYFAPSKPRVLPTGATSVVEGEPLTVRYQSFDGDKHTEVKSLTLGRLNTAASLFASLQKATGFKNYKVYCSGKEFDLDEVDVCKSLGDLKLNGLVLVQRREDADALLGNLGSSGTPTLEAEIINHFDDLWSYLSMNEKVAREIYYFLKQFPVYVKLITQFEANTPCSELFPAGQPYKILYAVHALSTYIGEQKRKGVTNDATITRAVSLIVAAISDKEILSQCSGDELRDYLALQMLDCLVDFLREHLLPTSVAPLLDETLLQRLLDLLSYSRDNDTAQNSAHLTWRSFEAILEASIHSPELWRLFSVHLSTSPLLSELVLEDPRASVRKSIVKLINSKCSFSPSLAQVTTIDFMVAFWPLVAVLIPKAAYRVQQCEETFALALALFKRLADISLDRIDLNDLVVQWGGILLEYTCSDSAGSLDGVDSVAHGLTHLMCHAATCAKASRQRLSCSEIGTALFHKHMFPELSVDNEDDTAIIPSIPLLNASTRRAMGEMIFLLIKDDVIQYRAVLSALSHLVPYTASDEIPYIYEMSFGFDRSRAIRSSAGYVGLKNLSNTCYLNSLFTQLFMNVPFREFMLNVDVAEGNNAQRLLSETQLLFSNMQNSLKRFVDPAALAFSIQTYDETSIDVAVQMDVDEFYNLLFDRLEGQIATEDAKKEFKSFYGGQLVQQVKSQECPHVSERLESFSAIQCDIKGKNTLQESLQAYVEGEIMAGDNKYKCSSCDRHVDAVKRACLKDIPDNLICHLKRFDFNIQRLQRSKINDYFSFPTKIDMRPYKVEYVKENPDAIPEDIFELVGVLIHAGTAESGHYYSYVRERPSTNESETWVEFNDDTVSTWDPSNMERDCFGGSDHRGSLDGNVQPLEKPFSAYKLFYQRSSVAASQKEALRLSNLSSPVRLPVPIRLSNHIAMENELLMRRYCLHDPSHAPFVIKMLSNVRKINGGSCGSSHSLEKLALIASLNHLDQVIARAKDTPDFASFMAVQRQICSSCAECSRDYLEWYCDCPDTLRQLLFRNPDSTVRADIAQSIMAALVLVNTEAPYAYGFGDDEDSSDDLEGGDPQLIQRLVKSLHRLWNNFHANTRAWPEYFGLLASIARIGNREATLLLDAGYLRKTLEIISADPLLPLGEQYQKMLNNISKRSGSRPVSYASVISLLSVLIKACDPSLDPVPDNAERFRLESGDSLVPLAMTERHLLTQHWTRNAVHIVCEKLLIINENQQCTDQIVFDLLNWPEQLDIYVINAIINNIRRCDLRGPFLRAAQICLKHSQNASAFETIISNIAGCAQKAMQNSVVGNFSQGMAFFSFFKSAYSIKSDHSSLSKEEQDRFYLEQVPIWAPCLLASPESNVRSETEEFLEDILFTPSSDLDAETRGYDLEDLLQTTSRQLGMNCLDYLRETYLTAQSKEPVRSQIVIIEKVIILCARSYDVDGKDLVTQRFTDLYHRVLPALKKAMVEEALDDDEEGSEWEASDGDYDESSDVPDGTAEFSADLVDDVGL